MTASELANHQSDLQLPLGRSNEAPAIARAAIGGWCASQSIGGDERDILRLLVSELVANAVQHTDTHTITISALRSDATALVRVGDKGTGPPPVMRDPDPLCGGFGLQLIDTFSENWGVERHEATSVWFELGLADDPRLGVAV